MLVPIKMLCSTGAAAVHTSNQRRHETKVSKVHRASVSNGCTPRLPLREAHLKADLIMFSKGLWPMPNPTHCFSSSTKKGCRHVFLFFSDFPSLIPLATFVPFYFTTSSSSCTCSKKLNCHSKSFKAMHSEQIKIPFVPAALRSALLLC